MDNLRNTVLNMLLQTLEKGEFSHIVINRAFSGSDCGINDRAFIKRLYTGTLEKLVYVDYVLHRFSKTPVHKMKPVIRTILRMSVYQLRFMDGVPAHACIDEAVKLTRKRGFQNLTGFVNGILRNISRETEDFQSLPAHVRASVPEWIYQLVQRQYGSDAELFFRSMQQEKEEVSIWLNTRKQTPEEILQVLAEDGCRIRKLPYPDDAYGISGFSSLTGLKAFREGLIMIQDVSSMMAADCAVRQAGQPRRILDVCAAPGGKSLYAARSYPDSCIIARDLTPYKVQKIRENAERLGYSNIIPQVFDACRMDAELVQSMDLVIADLPCSGLGVIGHKPDILYRLKENDLPQLQELQRSILTVVQQYVRPGGVLVYSTCTINREENEENTRWFLEQFEFSLQQEQSFFPGKDPGDGFYAACFLRK